VEASVVVQTDGAETRDLALRAPSSSTVAEVAAAVAAAMGLHNAGGWSMYSHRLEAWLPDDEPAAMCGLRHGDTVALAAAPAGVRALVGTAARPGGGASMVDVTVVGGPQVGLRVELAAGDHLIGRAEAAAVRLTDPFVAPEHARLSISTGRVVVTDLGSSSGTTLDGAQVEGSRVLRAGQVIGVGGSTLALGSLREAPTEPGAHGADVPFNRPPRVIVPAAGEVRRLSAPPAPVRRPRLPLLTALLPLLLGAVMLLVMRNALTLVFLAMSPVLAVGSYLESRVSGRSDYKRAAAEFHDKVAALATELEAATDTEVDRRAADAPDLRRAALAAHRREPWLWERRPQDDDFLELRTAVAELPSRHRVELADGGDEALRREALQRLEKLVTLRDVPLVVPFAERGAVGLAGPREPVLDTARWLIVQAATLHSPRNLAICAALPREEATEWDWLKWLPHTGASARQFEGSTLCADSAAARDLVERLVALLDARSGEVGPFRGTSARATYPYVLALLHEDLPLSRASLTRLLAEGPRVGIVVLWIGSAARDLPNECRAVVEVDAASRVTLTYPTEGLVHHGDGVADRASAAEARQVALELAPLRDTAAGDARGQLPVRVGLLEVLGVGEDVGGAAIAARWSSSADGLAAPLGVGAGGTFTVDLRGDGPHALVGGTTGAGKSELLQSLVSSLAASHSPRRLNFLLVDYKGGSAFKDAMDLPHTVGLVTDLDGHLAHRALVSLRAELRRREQVLRDASVRDLVELERRGDAGCPPSLIIVVDEFATLAREVPEFVEGIVDLAQRGRSLGLHLVLATQRPAGVINDNIRANTNLRIALRMSDEAESTDVIGVPDAARIPRTWPGRAFARTGHRDLTEFQAAYAGAPTGGGGADAVEVVAFGLSGPAWPTTTSADIVADEATELHRLAKAIAAAHSSLGDEPARRPWLPELPAVLPAASFSSAAAGGMALGLVDIPERQSQEPWVLDLATDGNLLVMGSGGSGKTSLLRALAHGLALAADPADLHLYAVDCAGGGLSAVQSLPHCGAYVRADETERLVRLLRWLRATIDTRRERTSAAMGAGRGTVDDAQVVVLLDGYGGFASALEKVDFGEHVDALPRLIADGPGVGVHFVLTADRRGAIPNAVSAIVSTRLVLRMADDDEYRNAGVPAEAIRGVRLPPGRGFLARGLEVQCAVLSATGAVEEQVRVVQEAADALRLRLGPVSVPGIRLLPATVTVESLPDSAAMEAVIGLDDADLGPAVLDFADAGQLVVGPPRSGRSNALVVAALGLHRSQGTHRLVLLAPRRSPLAELGVWDAIANGGDECQRVALELAAEMEGGPSAAGHAATTIVFIDDGEELADGPASTALEVVARRGRDRGVRVVGAVETGAAHRAYGGWIAEVRKSRQGLLLQPNVDIDGDLFGVRLPRRASAPFPVGRGFLVRRGTVTLVQVAIPGAS
jgi:S-DNA-T family DNA segregation ATPase FtsK/SpoIIIE